MLRKVIWINFLLLFTGFYGIAQVDTTIQVHMRHNVTVCVGAKVALVCPDSIPEEKVLTYEWLEKKDGGDTIVIGTGRSILVTPKKDTEYFLNIQYLDMNNNLVKEGDFEGIQDDCRQWPRPNKSSLPFKTDYDWNNWSCKSDALWGEGLFKIAHSANQFHYLFSPILDHTFNDGSRGKMLVVNGHPDSNVIVWQQKIRNVDRGKQYAFSVWGIKVSDGFSPLFQFSISNIENNFKVIGGLWEAYSVEKEWKHLFKIWTAEFSEAYITLIDQESHRAGNDFAVDDIVFAPILELKGDIKLNVIPRFSMETIQNQTVCEGETVTVDPIVYGSVDRYQWYKDGSSLSGQTGKILTLNQVRKTDAGIYRCEAIGKACSNGEGQFILTVNDSLRIEPLTDLTVCNTSEARLHLNILSGEDHITKYVWTGPATAKNWEGQYTDTYHKQKVTDADTGRYICRINSRCGDVSVATKLRLYPAIQVTHLTPGGTFCPGDSVTLIGKTNRPVQSYWKWGYESANYKKNENDTLGIRPNGVDVTYVYMVNDTLCRDVISPVPTIRLSPKDILRSLTLSQREEICDGSLLYVHPKATGSDSLHWSWEGPEHFTSSSQDLLITNFTTSKTGFYRLTVTDDCGNSLTDSVNVSTSEEFGTPVISGDLKVCEGENGRLEVTGGIDGLTYGWETPAGKKASSSVITLNRILPQDTGTYICHLVSACGTRRDLYAHVSLYPSVKATAPAAPYVVCEGDPVEFIVSGLQPEEHYVWSKGGVPVGENSPYIINAVRAEDGGRYECVVTSKCGESKTLEYVLQVQEQTMITGRCEDLYVTPGMPVKLFVNAKGSNLSYQWIKTGKGNIGFDENTLVYDAVTEGNAGEYICIVIGQCGTVRDTILLNVGDYNKVTKDQNVTLCIGSTYSYTAAARPTGCTESAALAYSWKAPNGRELSTTKALVLSDVTKDMEGEYTCTIAGTCGTLTLHLKVTVFEVPVISLAASKDTLCESEEVMLSASVNEIGGHTFEWRHDGIKLGTTINQHIIRDIAMTDAGKYTCKVTALCGESSEEVSLVVRKGLRIQSRPADQFLCKGSATGLKVEATGDSVTYAWGGPASEEWTGAHDATYRNPALSHNAAGQYRCVVNSSCGTDTVEVKVDVEKDLELLSRTPNLATCIGKKETLWARVNLDNSYYTWTFPDASVSHLVELEIPITLAQRGHYIFYIESPAGCSVLKDSIGVGVYNEPGPLSVYADTAICEGGQAHLIAEMEGVDVKYSWMGPGAFKSDTAIVDIMNVSPAMTGRYQVIAEDICEHEKIGEVTLSLRDDFKNIRVSADTAVCLYADLRLHIDGGIPEMTYAWFFNGEKIAETPELMLSHMGYADAGQYRCRVSTVCGFVEGTVEVGILRPLEFATVTDVSQTVCPGETVVFGVEALGTDVLYSWQKNGIDVGTMDSLLTLSNIESWEGGLYICHIASVCGEENVNFDLVVKDRTSIIGRSPDKYVSMNDSVKLFVIADGVNIRYEWKRNDIVEGIDSILRIPDVGNTIREEQYLVRVEGDCGVDSTDIWLRIGDYVDVPLNAADTICEGSDYTYAANLVPYGCYGGEPVQYTWTKKQPNGIEMELHRDTSALFKIQNVVTQDTGLYHCVITYKGCPIDGRDLSFTRDTSFDLRLDMIRIPEIVSVLPVDTSVIEGFDHKIEVTATGAALAYGWKKNNEVLTGINTDRLEFSPVKLEDAGIYRVTVSNECSHISGTSRLKVSQKTVIISPADQLVNICRYSDTTLAVEAVGNNLIYRWYRENRLLAASHRNSYILNRVDADVDFRCVVEGEGGYDTCYFRVRVQELPEVDIRGEFLICRSTDAYLQRYRAESPQEADLLWKWGITEGELRSLDTKQQVEALWGGTDGAEIYVVATSRFTGCATRAEKEVTYKPLPEVWLDLPEKVGYCIDSLVLNRAWPLGGYFVYGRDTVSALDFSVKTKDYGVIYHYADALTGCVATVGHQIGIDVEPSIRLAKRNDTTGVCSSVTLPVAFHTPGEIVWKGSGLHLDTTDVWNPLFSPVMADAENVYYEATLTDAYDCKASDYTRLRVVYPPQVIAMKDSIVGDCDKTTTVEINLSAQFITAYFDHINWIPGEKAEVQADYTANIFNLSAGENEFFAEVYDVFGCTGRDSVIVTLAQGPAIADKEICFGDSIYVDNSAYTDFRWHDGYDRPQRLIDFVGTDTLWVKDQYGCEALAIYTVRPLPQTSLTDTVLLKGYQLKMPLSLEPEYAPYDIEWQDGSAALVYLVEREGDYWVKVIDNMGCMTRDSMHITVINGIHAPDAFLPESSGENSRFYLKEVNFAGDFEMYIYNRWGELIYKTREIGFNGGWDGTCKGKKCDVGTYVWVAFNNGKRLARGTVTLIK